jgi:hypothetical protein
MKICSYCGREAPDKATYCSGCGQLFETSVSNSENSFVNRDWVLLTCCAKVPYEKLILSNLKLAGIQAFVPDACEFEKAGADTELISSMADNAWIYVHLKDYPAAKKALPEPEKPESSSLGPGEKRVIASMEAGQTGEVLKRLKLAGIPVEVRTTSNESGLETSEILVEDNYYDRGCDVVEALFEEQANSKPKRKFLCPNCGSQNCKSTPHIRLNWIIQCKDCGFEFQ